jgi:hypothetical protein
MKRENKDRNRKVDKNMDKSINRLEFRRKNK